MARTIENSPAVYRAHATRARRIAEMLLGTDAITVLAYAKECDDRADALALAESAAKTSNPAVRRTSLRRAA